MWLAPVTSDKILRSALRRIVTLKLIVARYNEWGNPPRGLTAEKCSGFHKNQMPAACADMAMIRQCSVNVYTARRSLVSFELASHTASVEYALHRCLVPTNLLREDKSAAITGRACK